MPTKLNTVNPESLIYSNGLLKLTVLGGIKIEGLDRMRATLKTELKKSPKPPVRHNLDLYNDSQCERYIRKVAEKLEIGTSVIEASIAELIEQLEKYRLDELKNKTPDTPQKVILTAKEVRAAQAFLETPNLLEKTNEYIGKSGMIGETDNRLLMYIIFTSRKREQPLHIVSLGASGMGKTHLQEKVSQLIPEEDKIEITTLSENAFYYFGQQELRNKLILIEDLDGAESSLYPLRELQSKKRISKTIAHKNSQGETRTIHLIVEGPVSVSGCTTKEQIYEDNANRSFLIYLDESKEQDTRIMNYQRKVSAGKINTDQEKLAAELLRNTQRVLEPIRVVNPYAEQLNLPKEILKPRRTNTHYLQFIEAVTYYHQYQRTKKVDKTTGELYIETEIEDIESANRLLKETLIRKTDTLTGACRNHFEKLKLYLIGQTQTQFSNLVISQKLRISLPTVKRHHLQLFNAGYLRYEKDKKSRTHYYQIISYKEYENLQNQVDNLLDETVKKLEKLKSSTSAQSINEPIQTTPIKENHTSAQKHTKKVS
jgi:predicted transcriptional regulator